MTSAMGNYAKAPSELDAIQESAELYLTIVFQNAHFFALIRGENVLKLEDIRPYLYVDYFLSALAEVGCHM